MRDFKGMKRQRGRNNRGGNGGKPQQHNANRAFDSNGPDGVKVRGAAQSVYEKYQQLARDASSSGDRVLAENYLQHAEHYFRVLRAIQPNRPVSDIVGKDVYAAYEIDFEAEPPEEPEVVETPADSQAQGEGGEGEGGEQRRDRFESRDRNRDRNDRNDRNRDDRPRDDRGRDGEGRRDRWRDRDDRSEGRDRNRDDRPRDDRPRDDRPRDDRPRDDRPRDDRPRDDRPRDDRPREDRFRDRDDRPRDDRPREDRPAAEGEQPQGEGEYREGRRRRDRNRDRDWQPRGERDPLAVIEPEASPLPTASAPVSESSPVLRGQDGAVSDAPAFLGRKTSRAAAAVEPTAEAPASADGEEVKKARRRRAPRSFEAGEGAPAETSSDEG